MMHQAISWKVALAHVRHHQYIYFFETTPKALTIFNLSLKIKILWTLFKVKKQMKQPFNWRGNTFFLWKAQFWRDEFEAFIYLHKRCHMKIRNLFLPLLFFFGIDDIERKVIVLIESKVWERQESNRQKNWTFFREHT